MFFWYNKNYFIEYNKKTCTNENLLTQFNKSEINDNFAYYCFEEDFFFNLFNREFKWDWSYANFEHKCLRAENNLPCSKDEITAGLSFNYTKAYFQNSEDFLKNTYEKVEFQSDIENLPYFYYFFNYNQLKNDVGLFENKFESTFYPSIKRQGVYASGVDAAVEGTFQIRVQMEEDYYIYTRVFPKLTAVIRESSSILILIATIFSLITNFAREYYCEKYIINILLSSKEKNVNLALSSENKLNNNSSNQHAANSKIKIDKVEVNTKPPIILENNYIKQLTKENFKNVNVLNFNKDIENYSLSILDFTLNKLPLLNNFTSKAYRKVKDLIDTSISLERIIFKQSK